MKFLFIVQDLRISGTSQGIVERSFLTKLKKNYPDARIDVLYLPHFDTNDNLEILPVDSVSKKVVSKNIPFHVKWINRLSTRIFNVLYAENYIHKQYAKAIKRIDCSKYDNVFVRSSGLEHEVILAMHNLPILNKSIIYFHDPYPYSWYKGEGTKIHKNEFLRLKKMIEVVQQAKTCCASAYYMAKDLQYLYASDKYFYNLPHQFELSAFDLSDKENVRKKQAKIQISYHGALMFGRNPFSLLEAYTQLMQEYEYIKNETEFVLRVKGSGVNKLKEKYSKNNIHILDCLNFSNSSNEQIYESDINVILENGPYYANTLGGKVPFLAETGKAVFILSPERSELRRIVKDENYSADMNNVNEIKTKLKKLIDNRLNNAEVPDIFGGYFSDEKFKDFLDDVLFDLKKK